MRAARIVIGVAAMLLASPAAAKVPPCASGRFLVADAPLIAGAQVSPADVIDLAAGAVAIDSGCASAKATLRPGRRVTTLRATWKGCAGLRGTVRLRAHIDAACGLMTGRFVARRSRLHRPFTAHRSACGDAVLDRAGGEECDAGFACPTGRPCNACRCPTPTTTTSSSTTTSSTVAPSTTRTTATTSSSIPDTTSTSTTATTASSGPDTLPPTTTVPEPTTSSTATSTSSSTSTSTTSSTSTTRTTTSTTATTVPPAGFRHDVFPILKESCGVPTCHAGVHAALGLDLSRVARAYAGLVNVASTECPSVARVAPADPEQSYLVWKLRGSGACFSGGRMPLDQPALPPGSVRVVTSWILGGARND